MIRACQRIHGLIPHPARVEAYRNIKAELFDAVEERLLASLMHPDKLEKASLNNVAYALTQVHTAGRLERGQSKQNWCMLARMIMESDQTLFPRRGQGAATLNGHTGHADEMTACNSPSGSEENSPLMRDNSSRVPSNLIP